MATRSQGVLASRGNWSCRFDAQGQLVQAEGIFSGGAHGIAKGVLDHLKFEQIVHQSTGFAPSHGHRVFCVEVRADHGDNMQKFEAFALKHGFIPELSKRRKMEEEASIRAQIHVDELREHRFKRLPPSEAERHIRSHTWESVGDYLTQVKGLAVNIADPQEAYQIGHYLMEKRYITKKTFEQLNEEINTAMNTGDHDRVFRMAVTGEKADLLEKNFPHLGAPAGERSVGR